MLKLIKNDLVISDGYVYRIHTEVSIEKLKKYIKQQFYETADITFEEWFEIQMQPKNQWKHLVAMVGEEYISTTIQPINWENIINNQRFGKYYFDEKDFFYVQHFYPIYDCIISFNKIHTQYDKYLGTVEELIENDMLPNSAICIANNLSPEQQLLLHNLLRKHKTNDDRQGGVYTSFDLYWNIIYI